MIKFVKMWVFDLKKCEKLFFFSSLELMIFISKRLLNSDNIHIDDEFFWKSILELKYTKFFKLPIATFPTIFFLMKKHYFIWIEKDKFKLTINK